MLDRIHEESILSYEEILTPFIPMLNNKNNEPLISIKIGEQFYDATIDTGASKSVLTKRPEDSQIEGTLRVRGAVGNARTVPKIKTKYLNIGPLSLDHSFLLIPSCPNNLVGRDLLCKIGATIQCNPSGQIFLQLPMNL